MTTSIDDAEIEDDDDLIEEGESLEPLAVPLVESLISDAFTSFRRPAALYDALVEGDLFAFVRLPTSFDCCLQLDTAYWRTVDPGLFGASFGDAPFRPENTFRASTADILSRTRMAIDGGKFEAWSAVVESAGILLYTIGDDDRFEPYDDANPPPADLLADILQRDIAHAPEAFARGEGYAAFALVSELELYRSRRVDRLESIGGARGCDWREIWAAGIGQIIDAGTQPKVLAGQIRDRLRSAGRPQVPSESTLIKEISRQTARYRTNYRKR